MEKNLKKKTDSNSIIDKNTSTNEIVDQKY